jgi:amidase
MSTRRAFLRSAGVAGAAFALLRSAPRSLAAASPSFLTSTDPSTEVTFMSAVRLAQLIREKKLSAVEATKAYLDRIEKVNGALNAVVTLCAERALEEARAADSALASGRLFGALHGVPFTIKDSLETAGVVSTAGTLGRESYVPGVDATVVARLRAAGAILIGKSNTPEFTLGGGGRGTYNLVFGQTYNPYNTKHSPAGSSGGAGAIVAAGGSAFDIGSDFGGSIRGPAHANGIAGIKPTTGRVPRTGHLPGYGGPFDAYQELGPMARRVEDLIAIMDLISGPDFEDPVAAPVPLGRAADVDLKKLRVAYYTDNKVAKPTAETIAAVRFAVRAITPAVASVTEDFHDGDAEGGPIRSAYVGADGGAWFQRMLDASGTKQASPGLARRITGKVLPAPEFTLLAEKQDAVRSRLLSWFSNYDVIVCPVSATPADLLDESTPPATPAGGGGGGSSFNSIYNLTGWPSVVVRAGTAPDGLPIGIQVVAHPWRDDVALAVAQAIEASTGGWKRPAI